MQASSPNTDVTYLTVTNADGRREAINLVAFSCTERRRQSARPAGGAALGPRDEPLRMFVSGFNNNSNKTKKKSIFTEEGINQYPSKVVPRLKTGRGLFSNSQTASHQL